MYKYIINQMVRLSLIKTGKIKKFDIYAFLYLVKTTKKIFIAYTTFRLNAYRMFVKYKNNNT